jgi:hypothetical protein
LEKATVVRNHVVVKLVGVICGILHHFKPLSDFVSQRQVQYHSTNEACKHNWPLHFAENDLGVAGVIGQFIKDHHHQGKLENKGQHGIHGQLNALLLSDFDDSLLLLHVFFVN